ncbi:hypothetical protein APR12_002216 [Nocardia amikacinitolerans]|nr:hypothetical protein [Nocardia amikacinitolerans]
MFPGDAGEEVRTTTRRDEHERAIVLPRGRRVSHADELIDGAFQELIDSALRGGPLTAACP